MGVYLRGLFGKKRRNTDRESGVGFSCIRVYNSVAFVVGLANYPHFWFSPPQRIFIKRAAMSHSSSDNAWRASEEIIDAVDAATAIKKKRLAHLLDSDDDNSDDGFDVMRQKLRDMQNNRKEGQFTPSVDARRSTKQSKARRGNHVKATTAPAAAMDAVTGTAVESKKTNAPATDTCSSVNKKQKIRSKDAKKTTAPVAAMASVATTTITTAAAESTKQSSVKTKEQSQEVIELLDDSESDDDNPVPVHERKRKARPSASSLDDEVKSMGIRAIKRELESYGISTALFIEKSELVIALVQARRKGEVPITKKQDALIPFHLFATSSSKRLSQEKRQYFKTLRQVIGLDVPNRRLKWLVVSNFALDFGYLLEQTLPEILHCHRVVVFYSYCHNPNAMTRWREFLRGSGNTVEFIELDPSAPANSRTNPLPISIEYGMHHTKMSLTGYEDITDGFSQSMIRVAIHTSNLLRGDNEMKANGAYTQNFPLKQNRASHNAYKRMKSDDDDTESSCSFEVDLARYLESYGYSKRQRWCPPASSFDSSRPLSSNECSLPELIRQYDYSSAYAVLIPSIPGRHKVDSYNDVGYLKLRRAIMDAFPRHPEAGSENTKPPVLCQMSSLGCLNSKWLDKFSEAIDYTSTHGTKPVKDYAIVSKNRPPLQNQLRIIWPTVDEIRNSVEGYHGGGSVCGKTKNVSKEFLQPLYCHWSNSGNDPLQTARHVPHIKTFLQPSHDGRSVEWLCLTSHNLSIAAWGQVQIRSKNQTSDEKILFVRHWELGVFVSAATLSKARGDGKQVRIVPLAAGYDNDNNGAICIDCDDDEDGENDDIIRVPLPYSIQVLMYDNNDIPWTDDPVFYAQQDAYGRHGLL